MDLHLERPWDRNITITTRRVDVVSTHMLLNTFASGRIDLLRLITHHFAFGRSLEA